MAYYFFPGCKVTAQFKDASKAAGEYINQKFGIKPIGCCRPNHKKLTAEDTAIVVCNNCAAIIEENTDAINMGGKQGVHLLELLFPPQEESR